MKCFSCGHDNPPGQKFCGECGSRLEAVCPSCQSKNPPGQKFCGECGAPLGGAPRPAPAPAAAPPAAQAAPAPAERFASPQSYTPKHLAEKILSSRSAVEGERKQVSVMFTDVSGFTAMSERLDPEEVHGIMDRVFEIVLAAVHRFEGTINQFLGDGVMALFGAPIAHEDHAHRALGAALAIQRDLQPVRDDVRRLHGVEFRLRIGINTGLVVVGAIGRDLRMDYTAVGDTTNLASRMLNVAQPGQTVCTPATHRLTAGFFEFEDLGEFTVKGKSEPVRGWTVVRERRGRTRLEVSRERGLTPLLGRGEELEALGLAYARAVEGHGAVLMLVGDAGVGKSRLLFEFLHRLDGGSHVELEASCLSYGRAIAYHPVAGLVRRYLGLPDGAGDDDVRAAARVRLHGLGIADDESVTLLAHFLGVEAPAELLTRLGAQVKERTHALLRDVFLRASQRRPLVLVVENIHWVDPSSEEFFGPFIDALFGHPILLLLSSRPDFSMTTWPRERVEMLSIEGLGREQAADMARALLGSEEVAPQLIEVLVAKSEGNPLYVEEILRQLQETGGAVVVDGEARLSRADISVPETVHDIIASRVDRVEEPLKQTIQGAAVVGRQFPAPLVARVLAAEEPRVVDDLRRLQRFDFVFPVSMPVYAFKHALTQEVVYTGLLERRRRTYHAIVGTALEEEHPGRLEEVAELLAHHFGRSAEHGKAVDYALLAGEKSQRRWANAEALTYFEAALKRLDAMPDSEGNRRRRIDAVLKQAEVKFALGRHAEELSALEELQALVEASADPPRRAAWYYWAGFLRSLTGASAEVSIDYCQKAVAIAEAEGLDELRAYAQACLAHVYLVAGNLEGGLAAGEAALATFEARGNPWWACRTIWALQPLATGAGDWGRGLAVCRRALEHATATNDQRLKIVGHVRLAGTEVQRGDPAACLRACETALALSPAPFDAALIKAVRAYGRVKSGDIDTGLAELGEAVAWFERAQLLYTSAVFGLWLADAHLRRGESAPAAELAQRALAVTRERGYRHVEGMTCRVLGEALLERDAASAGRHLDDAARVLEAVGARNELARTWAAQGRLCAAAGDSAGARQRLTRALQTFEALGTLDEIARTSAVLEALR
jgi:class 3 adenylate cyclase/tetratricopeptide (TPR) repeat protein